mgnify:CR=1 FL=1
MRENDRFDPRDVANEGRPLGEKREAARRGADVPRRTRSLHVHEAAGKGVRDSRRCQVHLAVSDEHGLTDGLLKRIRLHDQLHSEGPRNLRVVQVPELDPGEALKKETGLGALRGVI